jgi:hypothetical protein
MRDFYRVGFATVLAVVFGGSAANAQVGGGSPGGPAPGGASSGASSDLDDQGGEPREPIAKKGAPSGPQRTPKFNRVTSTRKEVVPLPSQAARGSRPGSPSSASASASRAAGMQPYTARASKDRARAASAAIPGDSTWRSARPASRPPATTVRSTARNYYPGMRPGVHPNADQAQVRAKSRNSMGTGMGAGGLSGGRSAQAGRAGSTPALGHGPAPAAAAPTHR